MSLNVPTSDCADPAYPDGSMRVDEATTPDGRRLLYFTFPTGDDAAAGDASRVSVGDDSAPVIGPSSDV